MTRATKRSVASERDAVLRAVVYARVSSAQQRDRHTIASQISTLPKFIAERGWKLVRPADVYVDDGRTAKAGNLEARDGFVRLMRDAEAGVFDVVVVVDLDRLTRSDDLTERGRILGTFQKAGVHIAIASTGQVLDLATSMGDLLGSLQTFFAADWLRKHRERIKRGKDRAIAEGRKPAGPTPYGLRYSRDRGEWSVEDAERAVLVELFERVARGDSCPEIARDFDVRGVARRFARYWTRERVHALVRSKTYRGEYTADKRRKLVVPVPRIISDELWFAAEAALKRWGKRGLRRTQHVYLLEGIGRCAHCGAPIWIVWGGRDPRRPYYTCRDRLRPRGGVHGGGGRCRLKMQPTAVVDARLWAKITETLERPDLLADAVAGQKSSMQPSAHDWAADLRDYEIKLRRCEGAEKALLERFQRGLISETAMDEALTRAAKERALLKRQIETARATGVGAKRDQAAMTAVLANMATLRARLADATSEARSEIVRALVPGRDEHVIVLGDASIEIHIILSSGPTTAATVPTPRAATAQANLGVAMASGSCYKKPHDGDQGLLLLFRVVA